VCRPSSCRRSSSPRTQTSTSQHSRSCRSFVRASMGDFGRRATSVGDFGRRAASVGQAARMKCLKERGNTFLHFLPQRQSGSTLRIICWRSFSIRAHLRGKFAFASVIRDSLTRTCSPRAPLDRWGLFGASKKTQAHRGARTRGSSVLVKVSNGNQGQDARGGGRYWERRVGA
jgi:hypothetical protein